MLERPFNNPNGYPYPIGPQGPYAVNHWGSHPDAGNDDCYSGSNYVTIQDAMVAFMAECNDRNVAYIQLDGPGYNGERKNPNYSPTPDDDSEWRSEMAMQAGMAFGCDGYNDIMGY